MKTLKPRARSSFRKDTETLLKALKKSVDPVEGYLPVTFGFSLFEDGNLDWSYQTGDNSYSGGAYCHPNWATVDLQRRSNCRELSKEILSQVDEMLWTLP